MASVVRPAAETRHGRALRAEDAAKMEFLPWRAILRKFRALRRPRSTVPPNLPSISSAQKSLPHGRVSFLSYSVPSASPR